MRNSFQRKGLQLPRVWISRLHSCNQLRKNDCTYTAVPSSPCIVSWIADTTNGSAPESTQRTDPKKSAAPTCFGRCTAYEKGTGNGSNLWHEVNIKFDCLWHIRASYCVLRGIALNTSDIRKVAKAYVQELLATCNLHDVSFHIAFRATLSGEFT